MGILTDFNYLYSSIEEEYKLEYKIHCQNAKLTQPVTLQTIKTYFCCAVNSSNKCVLHNCVPVIVGTWLDKHFRGDTDNNDYGFAGTFIIDGRHFSFPNIMMNNNVLVHNFFDKQYARDKKMKRMFLYGNFDDDKYINRAIQLVYDKVDDVLYVRDVYAKDYIVDKSINKVLGEYLKCSGKWPEMDFMFSFENYNKIFEQLKKIMSIDLTYQIDSLSNKIIYKHSYLVQLTLNGVLQKVKKNSTDESTNTKKKNTILFGAESKKIYDTIVTGKLIQSVSKTLSKQKKYDQEYNSNNNNLEVFPLQHRIGNEVLRVINENLQQDMLKHTDDYVKFIDSFFHGEMTVAGKKFFLCHNTILPDVNYKHVAKLFLQLIHLKLLFEITNNESEFISQNLGLKNSSKKLEFINLLVVFNNRPTKYYCNKKNLYDVYYHLKRRRSPVEVKLHQDILCINHHEGMVMLKKTVCIDNTIRIHTLQTAYEYHNTHSLVNTDGVLMFDENTIEETTTISLMSTMILNYYKNYLNIFSSVPVAKLIVSLTNLKNGMVVQKHNFATLPIGNSVVVDDSIYHNDRMFCLWTIVMDIKLKTAEDPYIPHTHLPIKIYHNKVHRVKGKIVCGDVSMSNNQNTPLSSPPPGGVVCEYKTSKTNNIIPVEGENYLCIFGTLVCTNKINWNHDGKKYKIEYCTSKMWHVYKFYMYFRRVNGQTVCKIDSTMSCDETGNVLVKLELVYNVSDLEGIKICGIHGQKGVLNEAEDLSSFVSEDDPNVHAQICLSPISYLSRQTNFKNVLTKHCVVNGVRYPLILIPYMFFNNTPDNIYKEFIGNNINGYEKLEGTRLDQWSINQSFVGNRLSEGLHCVRNGNNMTECSGQFNVFQSLLHCNNIKITL
ncbi:lef-8 [Clostera anastomosis granulovirus B]|uniref:Lef-8 n=2 Tax=Betabaculovirus TaxID=558017 RepID=A0A0K0WSQ8_9BBAC|nr:lef-8 [Clostera anastomosis granulovirus B]AKS25458.1 lef-8 [Clostera anastomosis granulovirus B]